jgi:hypothetical protein
MASLLTIDRKVGRLVETRFSGNPTPDDVADWARELSVCLKTTAARTGKPAVCCTDLRASALFRPSVTDALTSIMRSDNTLIERNGMLGTNGATFALQAQRILRESAPIGGAVRRRIFVDFDLLCHWLDELLTPVESARVRAFMGEFEPPTAEIGAGPFHHAWIDTPVGVGSSQRPPAPFRTEPDQAAPRRAAPSSPEDRALNDADASARPTELGKGRFRGPKGAGY